jgi:hypothetical protein
MGIDIFFKSITIGVVSMVLKHTGTVLMSASWLLLSLFRCAFEPAPVSSSLPNAAVARLAVSSTSQSKLLFHRLTLVETIFGLEKSGYGGECDFAPDQPSIVSWLRTRQLSFEPDNLAQAWQFKLRAALNPRAPSLS